MDADHTRGRMCPPCSEPPHFNEDGERVWASCVHTKYSPRWLSFRAAHADAFQSVYEGDSGAASHEMERLGREYATLPRGHLCTCTPQACRWWSPHGGACVECRRLHELRRKQDVAVALPSRGKMALEHSPVPAPEALDEALARKHGARTPGEMARWLNGERSDG